MCAGILLRRLSRDVVVRFCKACTEMLMAPPKQLVPDSAFDALAGRHVSPFSDPPFGRAFGGFWSALTGRQSPTPAGGPEERR